MNWQQIHITIPKDQLENVEDFLLEIGSLSVTYKDAGDNPVLEPLPGETPLWPELIVTGLFDENYDMPVVINTLKDKFSGYTIELEQLEDKNWERAWMDDYHPMKFGDRLWIIPSTFDAPDPQAVNLVLDPGLAFGTGTHPTTALCLQWLDQNNIANCDVLDYGCGSGILAIAALLLDAIHADGVDIDPQAIIASKDNAGKNQVDSKLELYLPDDFNHREYDIVMANILSGPLQELAPQLASYTKAGGNIVLSGILEQQANDVKKTYENWFDMNPVVIKDDWAMLSGKKR